MALLTSTREILRLAEELSGRPVRVREDQNLSVFEIAIVGMNGINVNDPKSEYRLRTLPGAFSGLKLLCYEYAAFKQFAPDLDIGFDLSQEYKEAQRMQGIL